MKENIEIVEAFLEECDKDLAGEICLKCDGLTRNAIEGILLDYKKQPEMKEDIEEVVERLEKSINDVWFSTIYSQEDEERDLQILLSDYKRVLKENEELKKFITEGITIEPNSPYKNYQLEFLRENFISKQKIEEIIERIDYDIKKTKEIIFNNVNNYTSNRKNDYQIVRLRAMNTKSLDIKNRLQDLLEEKGE